MPNLRKQFIASRRHSFRHGRLCNHSQGERCSECGEEFPYENEAQKAIEIARKVGIWPEPLKLHRHLSKSAGGLVLRIPSDIERQFNLNENVEITISKIGNKIVIEPI